MSHTYEFHQSPNKSLRPALRSIFEESICSDLQLVVNKKKSFPVNKCIIAVRSPPLADLIEGAPEGSTKIEVECEHNIELFELMLTWIYSASVQMPEDIFKVSELFFLAYDFQIPDLMSRCENEVINKITSVNVTDVLLLFFPARNRKQKVKFFVRKPSLPLIPYPNEEELKTGEIRQIDVPEVESPGLIDEIDNEDEEVE